MCANGVNTQQLKDTVTQIDETIALTRPIVLQQF